MKKHGFLWSSLLAAFLLAACGESQERGETAYFDLSSYMNEEAKRLTGDGVRLIKWVEAENKSEKKMFDKPNWHNELRLIIP